MNKSFATRRIIASILMVVLLVALFPNFTIRVGAESIPASISETVTWESGSATSAAISVYGGADLSSAVTITVNGTVDIGHKVSFYKSSNGTGSAGYVKIVGGGAAVR